MIHAELPHLGERVVAVRAARYAKLLWRVGYRRRRR